MLIINPEQKNQIEEFIDQDHAVMDEYYTIFDGDMTRKDVLKLMHKLMKVDPDFYDTYHIVIGVLFEENKTEQAGKLLKDAYIRALTRIVDAQGQWPKLMRWGFLENRHLMRIIDRYALYCWDTGNTDEALPIYRKLLAVNPNDNQGARESILAIRMGMSFKGWEKKFALKDGDGLDAMKLAKWFDTHAKKFPEEFEEFFAYDEE